MHITDSEALHAKVLRLNQWGLIVGWACATANVANNTFQWTSGGIRAHVMREMSLNAPAGPPWLIRQVDGRMIVFSDTGFHAAEGDPSNLKVCQRGEWEERMLVETVLRLCIASGHLSTPGSRSPWPSSMSWPSGMVYNPPRRVSCPSRSLSLVCKILMWLFGLAETNTIGS
jgi:hypothetical protein